MVTGIDCKEPGVGGGVQELVHFVHLHYVFFLHMHTLLLLKIKFKSYTLPIE